MTLRRKALQVVADFTIAALATAAYGAPPAKSGNNVSPDHHAHVIRHAGAMPVPLPKAAGVKKPAVKKLAPAKQKPSVEKPIVFSPSTKPYYAEIYDRKPSDVFSPAALTFSQTSFDPLLASVNSGALFTGITLDSFSISGAGGDENKPLMILQSTDFNPSARITMASHMKMLLAACVLDADPQLADPENRRLMRLSLFNSDSMAAEALGKKIARQLAPDSTKPIYLMVRDMMNAKAHEIGLSDQFYAANASGHPQIVYRGETRADSWGEPKDLIKIDLYLSQHHQKVLEDFYRTVGQDPKDRPTNNLIWPLLSKNNPPPAKTDSQTKMAIEVDAKTGTDDYISLAPLMRAVTPDKIIIVYYHHQKNDWRPPIATGASILMDVLRKVGVDNPDLFARLQGIANQTIKPKDVGSPWMAALTGHKPRKAETPKTALASAKTHEKPHLPHARPASLASALAAKTQ